MRGNNHLTTTIEVKDKTGRVVARKEVATYAGLLAKAHDEGLRTIRTELLHKPDEQNGRTAVVRALVVTRRGTFTGIGDASPTNVRAGIAAHLIRMAETRAKARALRDAVNIGVVALEELGELLADEHSYDGEVEPAASPAGQEAPPRRPPARVRPDGDPQNAPPAHGTTPFPSRADFQPMSDNQRRFLFRLAAQRGVKPDEAKAWLEKEAGVESLKTLSRADASHLIDQIQAANGAPSAAQVA